MTVFFYRDVSGFGAIYAALDDDGVLEIALSLKPGSPVKGHQLFSQALGHFGLEVKTIRGNWTWGVNLVKVNQLTARGIHLEEAARGTWTARQCIQKGYTISEVRSFEGVAGNYTALQVDFTKP